MFPLVTLALAYMMQPGTEAEFADKYQKLRVCSTQRYLADQVTTRGIKCAKGNPPPSLAGACPTYSSERHS